MPILTDKFTTAITDIHHDGSAFTELYLGDKVLKADISEKITEKDPERAPFMRFLEMLGSKAVTQNWKFECFEEDRKATKATINDNGTTVVGSASEESLEVDESNLFVAGDLLMLIDTSAGTFERVRVISKTSAVLYEVTRAYSDTTGLATFADGDEVIKIGSVYSENTGAADPDNIEPAWYYNVVQNFKESVEISGRMLAMAAYGDYNELTKQVRSRYRHFNESEEGAFIFGGRKYNEQGTKTGRTTTGGLYWCIDNWADSANIKDASAETFNQIYLDNIGNDVFRYGSGKKLAIVSGKTISKIGDFATSHLRINEKVTKKLGVQVTDLDTAHGTFSFIHSRTFEQSVVWEKYMIIVDPAHVKKRFMQGRDVTLKTNVQDNDQDGKKHSIEADIGLDLRLPDSHFVITGIDNTIT